jgi:hypothetical protein
MRGFADLRSSILRKRKYQATALRKRTYNCVFMLSNGVTASNDSVAPAPKPAITVAGPETFPSASASRSL